MKFKIIVRDVSDLNHNIELLTPQELAEQALLCYGLCNIILNEDNVADENKRLVGYIRYRFGDFIDYTNKLLDAYFGDADKTKSRLTESLEKFKARIMQSQSILADYFNLKKIDWNFIKEL